MTEKITGRIACSWESGGGVSKQDEACSWRPLTDSPLVLGRARDRGKSSKTQTLGQITFIGVFLSLFTPWLPIQLKAVAAPGACRVNGGGV